MRLIATQSTPILEALPGSILVAGSRRLLMDELVATRDEVHVYGWPEGRRSGKRVKEVFGRSAVVQVEAGPDDSRRVLLALANGQYETVAGLDDLTVTLEFGDGWLVTLSVPEEEGAFQPVLAAVPDDDVDDGELLPDPNDPVEEEAEGF